MKKIYLFSFLILCIQLSVFPQKNKEKIAYMLEDAEAYVEERNWDKAYDRFSTLNELDKTNLYYIFQKGLCALHIPAKKTESIDLFNKIKLEKPEEKLVHYYLGRAYHANYKFDEAIQNFEEFLNSKVEQENYREQAERYLNNSKFGKNLVRTMLNAEIQNLGEPINTPNNEYVPVISADQSVMIYTYRGERSKGGLINHKFKPDLDGSYYEDIFISKKNADRSWSEPEGISDLINTLHHDASIGLSPDGQELFTYYSTDKDGGDIFVCYLLGDTWSNPEKLNENINTKYWEGSCSVTADRKYLFFASERPGGFGGKDIYISERQADGQWGPATNLGPKINTKQDDDAPFIHPDGITLFFSSEGHNSIGGFDIMFSIKKDGDWTIPMNMGYPLNTTDDDLFYIITPKGDLGYFSSNRNNLGGKGGFDIYTVTPGIVGEKPVVAMILGNIYGNDLPLESNITIVKKSNGEQFGPFKSNSKTGKYLVALTPGETYTFKINANGFDEYSEELDLSRLSRFVEIKKDFHLSKDGFADVHADTIKKLNELVILNADTFQGNALKENKLDTAAIVSNSETKQAEIKNVKPEENKLTTDPCAGSGDLDFSEFKGKSLSDQNLYAKLLEMTKKLCVKNLEFKVQVAAYKKPGNYKWNHLKSLGVPQKTAYPDGITRFTMGSFTSFQEADVLKRKAIQLGQPDSWIVGFVGDKRYTLEELIALDFFSKNL